MIPITTEDLAKLYPNSPLESLQPDAKTLTDYLNFPPFPSTEPPKPLPTQKVRSLQHPDGSLILLPDKETRTLMEGGSKVIQIALLIQKGPRNQLHTSEIGCAKPKTTSKKTDYSRKDLIKRNLYLMHREVECLKLCWHHDVPHIIDPFIPLTYRSRKTGKVKKRFLITLRGESLCDVSRFKQLKSKVYSSLLETLSALEKKGWTHVDIKPDNILIEEKKNQLQVYLCDWAGLHAPGVLTRPNPLMFTRSYIAPEYARCYFLPEKERKEKKLESITPKMDVWSAGLLFLQLEQFELAKSLMPQSNEIEGLRPRAQAFDTNTLSLPETQDPYLQLIYKMLEPRPENRISASRALEEFHELQSCPN